MKKIDYRPFMFVLGSMSLLGGAFAQSTTSQGNGATAGSSYSGTTGTAPIGQTIPTNPSNINSSSPDLSGNNVDRNGAINYRRLPSSQEIQYGTPNANPSQQNSAQAPFGQPAAPTDQQKPSSGTSGNVR